MPGRFFSRTTPISSPWPSPPSPFRPPAREAARLRRLHTGVCRHHRRISSIPPESVSQHPSLFPYSLPHLPEHPQNTSSCLIWPQDDEADATWRSPPPDDTPARSLHRFRTHAGYLTTSLNSPSYSARRRRLLRPGTPSELRRKSTRAVPRREFLAGNLGRR
jgi:hypothetical protein